MRPLQLAFEYMKIFYSGNDLDRLSDLLAVDFTFKGTIYNFDSAAGYIESLKSNPPIDFEYTVLQSYESESSACLIYEFSKPGVRTLMAQTFHIRGERISKMILIFDPRPFA